MIRFLFFVLAILAVATSGCVVPQQPPQQVNQSITVPNNQTAEQSQPRDKRDVRVTVTTTRGYPVPVYVAPCRPACPPPRPSCPGPDCPRPHHATN